MKLRHRALSLLLSLAIMLTFMPAMAFAAVPEGANTKKATALKYEGNLEYLVDEYGDASFSGFWDEGNKITVTWGDTEEVFLCKEYTYKDSYGDTGTSTSYFPENEEPNLVEDEDGGFYPNNDVYFYHEAASDGKITISYDYEYYYESEEDSYWDNDTISTTVQGITPESISYEGPAFLYEPFEGPTEVYPYAEGAKIIIHYTDGSTKAMVCKSWENSDGEDTWTNYNYFWENQEPKIITDEYGDKYVDNAVYPEFKEDEATVDGLPVEYYGAKGIIPVEEKTYFKPASFEFIQNSTVYSEVGQKYLYGLGGEGNIIRLTDADGNVRDYVYGEYDDDWWTFFYTDEEGKHSLWIYDVTLSKRISKKGTSTVSGKIKLECDGGYMYTFPVNVKVSASTYYTEVLYKEYTYTGKKITPKIVVKYFNGKSMKTMPKSWYTTNAKKKSAIGEYRYKITIKSKYRKKYGKYLYGWFSIIPKKPTIKSATGGSGKVTVKWSKFSSSARKNINGFVVQIAKNRKFTKDDEYYWVEKKTASQYTINDLDPGKYYVRVVTYKDVKKYGSVWSKPSKIKAVTVK